VNIFIAENMFSVCKKVIEKKENKNKDIKDTKYTEKYYPHREARQRNFI